MAGIHVMRRLAELLKRLMYFRRDQDTEDLEVLLEQLERYRPFLHGTGRSATGFSFNPRFHEQPLTVSGDCNLYSADYELVQSMKATRRELRELLYFSPTDLYGDEQEQA